MEPAQFIYTTISSIITVLVAIVGFFLVRKFTSDDKNSDKNAEKNEKLKDDVMHLRIFMEKMNEHMRHINDDMDDIKSEVKEAVVVGKNIKDLQSEITVLRKSIEAAWRIIENMDPNIIGRKRHSS